MFDDDHVNANLEQDASYEDRLQELGITFEMPTDPVEQAIIFWSANLAGEAGELLNKVKKRYMKGGTQSGQRVHIEDILEELGDVQACSAFLAKELGTDLLTVRRQNLAKLTRRLT